MPRAFVIRPFGPKKDSAGNDIDFELIHEKLIAPALQEAGLSGSTTGEIVEAGNIREDMFGLIVEADLVICDMTLLNANVFYELGIRHALRKKATVLMKGKPTGDATPFDLLTDRYMSYPIADPGKAKPELVRVIKDSLLGTRPTDSPIFQMLPALREVDVSAVQVAPPDFREEVERARAARSKGWLRLLADDVEDRRFRWVGLKLIGQAQWDLKDYDAATETWELIRATYPNDIEANLALSNIYERQYRDTGNLELLERSNQAIERVLDNPEIDRTCRAEALALSGRNQKTQWRSQLDAAAGLQESRKAAMNPALMKAYESYRTAFLFDLNSFWAGLAAVQLGSILLDLSKEGFWPNAFEDDDAADAYAKRLQTDIPRLLATVRVAIEAELKRLKPDTKDRIWAEISAADARFLDPNAPEQRVIGAYIAAVPANAPFFWDAARGQLELFARLGFRADLAQKVLEAVSPKAQAPASPGAVRGVHLVMLAGHQIDTPDRTTPRFPAASEEKARGLMRERLHRVMNGQPETIVALASGASGADILAHELCLELGIASTVCLPMTANEYARRCFAGALDTWRGRYLDIIEKRKGSLFELSDINGLPRWLQGSNTDPWERGNRWVLQIARAWGASRMTLIALWDQRMDAAAPRGGTAHMVQLARDAGNIHVEVIDANQLLG